MTYTQLYIENHMSKEDWICILSEKFTIKVTADILGCNAKMVRDAAKKYPWCRK